MFLQSLELKTWSCWAVHHPNSAHVSCHLRKVSAQAPWRCHRSFLFSLKLTPLFVLAFRLSCHSKLCFWRHLKLLTLSTAPSRCIRFWQFYWRTYSWSLAFTCVLLASPYMGFQFRTQWHFFFDPIDFLLFCLTSWAVIKMGCRCSKSHSLCLKAVTRSQSWSPLTVQALS